MHFKVKDTAFTREETHVLNHLIDLSPRLTAFLEQWEHNNPTDAEYAMKRLKQKSGTEPALPCVTFSQGRQLFANDYPQPAFKMGQFWYHETTEHLFIVLPKKAPLQSLNDLCIVSVFSRWCYEIEEKDAHGKLIYAPTLNEFSSIDVQTHVDHWCINHSKKS